MSVEVNQRVLREKEVHNNGIDRKKYKSTLGHVRYLWDKRRLTLIQNYFSSCLDKPMLELGSGIWFHWLEMNDLVAKDLTCINISERDLEQGIERSKTTRNKPKFEIMDAHKLKFPDNSLSMIFGAGILHHLDLEIALSEIERVLVPGGKYFFMEPLDINPVAKFIRFLTPNARTVDECPFTIKQINLTKNISPRAKFECEALLTVPIGVVSKLIIDRPDNWLNQTGFWLDQGLCKIPLLKYLSREMTIMRL